MMRIMMRASWLLLLALLISVPGFFQVEGQATEGGGLRVTTVQPSGGIAPVDTAILVIFDRPVVALGLASDTGRTLPDPLRFDPPVSGRGEWVNTAIYRFTPDSPLSGGISYTVTVDPQLAALDGTRQTTPYSWTFATDAPRITEVVPRDNSRDVVLDQQVQVRFSQPMDRASVERSFRLRPSGGGDVVSGTFEWAEDDAGFRFTPSEQLLRDTTYAIQFSSINGLPVPRSGGAALEGTTQTTFSTVMLPYLIGSSPQHNTQNAYPYGGITLYFSTPMDVDTLAERIIIDPPPARAFDSYYSEWDNSYTVAFSTEPSTRYTVTILPGMRDIYGAELENPETITYTTAPYGSELYIDAPNIGFYNAGNEATRLFVRHRNVSRLDLELYQLEQSDLPRVVAGRRYGLPSVTLNRENSLRTWTIPSVAPLNVLRYEYLNLGDQRGETLCEGAPSSRVRTGDVVRVITSPDTLRARAEPLTGAVLRQLNNGFTAPVVGGPSCGGGYTWWQLQITADTLAWVAEGDQTEYYIEVESRAGVSEVELTDLRGAALEPGTYYLRVRAPEVRHSLDHILVVGSASLTMKNDTDSVLVWATDINSGQPIPDAPVSLIDNRGNVISQQNTNADGLVTFSYPRASNVFGELGAVLQTPTHYGAGSISWSDGIEGYWFSGVNTDYYPERYRAYLYTDRPVYRPGQPVYLRGVLRTREDASYQPIGAATVPARIFDPEGNIIWEQTLSLTEAGTFSTQFDIAPDAQLGYYRFDTVLPGENPASTWTMIGTIDFGVAEYRLPEFQVTLTPDAPEVAAGEQIQVVVDARFFFGGAVSGARVAYTVAASPYSFDRYRGPGNYTFTDYDADGTPDFYYSPSSEIITRGDIVADERGQAIITFPAEIGTARTSREFTIEATVFDESGQTVSGRTQVVVHRGAVYIGVSPEEYVGAAESENTFNLIAVDWAGAPVAGQVIDLEFVERRWSSTRERGADGRSVWQYEVEEIPVGRATVTTDADGRARAAFTPPNGGVFKLKARARDAAGREVISAASTWVSSSDYVAWRMQNSNRIDLIADRADYQIGDTAEILIAHPFQGVVQALVTVERGDVLFSEVITLESNSTVYRLPIMEEYSPNLFVSAFIVKGVDETNPVAAFRMGIVGMTVETTRRALTVEITPDRESAGPGDTVTYTLRTTDYTGAPVKAEVGVALTDLASLSIADPNQIDILTYYFSPQGLGVLTSSPLTINVDQVTQEILDTVKGGGGGFGEGGIFDIREEFIDTPYWNGSVVTGTDGTAQVSITLPDNLTTWRLDARAVSLPADAAMRVGSATHDLISTKPLLVRAITPRFFVDGDVVTLAAIVNNNTDQDLTVDVRMISTPALEYLNGRDTERVTVAAGARTRVDFPVRVSLDSDARFLNLTFTAADSTGQFRDATIPPLAGDAGLRVLRYTVPETVGTAGVLDEAGVRTEAIVLPTALPIYDPQVSVEVEYSLAASTVDALDWLRNFPQECTEQTISRFLPNIMTLRALTNAGIDSTTLSADLDRAVSFALQKLLREQKADGGWGWYARYDSDTLTTAYALIGLSEASREGYPVPSAVLDSAARFLRNRLITPDLSRRRWEIDRQAFLLYALARAGYPEAGRTANLFEERARLSLYAQAFLALTFAESNPADVRARSILNDLTRSAAISASGVSWTESERDYFNWNTDTRTSALILQAFIRIEPTNDLIPNIVRYLVAQRTADAWETTQETAWVVMALTDYMVATDDINPAYNWGLTVSGQAAAGERVTPDMNNDSVQLMLGEDDLLADEPTVLTFTRDEGTGSLYYRAFLRASLPVASVRARDNGIIISRRYVLNGETVDGAQVGDTVQVRLSIIAPTDLHYVLIQDPIPAGTDAIDPSLRISQQLEMQTGMADERGDLYNWGYGWWLFDNAAFRDDRVEIAIDYLPAGTYEYVYNIRAGLAGTYQVIPPTAQEFYFPDVYGRGDGSTFTITAP
jgi:uncharacterized protein YfaS (alpha-2-macroglobulin family)